MTFADWFFPWRARKRILFLERAIPKETPQLQGALDHEKRDHASTRDRLAKLEMEHQKIKVASQALAVWIRAVHRLDDVQPTKEPKNLLK